MWCAILFSLVRTYTYTHKRHEKANSMLRRAEEPQQNKLLAAAAVVVIGAMWCEELLALPRADDVRARTDRGGCSGGACCLLSPAIDDLRHQSVQQHDSCVVCCLVLRNYRMDHTRC